MIVLKSAQPQDSDLMASVLNASISDWEEDVEENQVLKEYPQKDDVEVTSTKSRNAAGYPIKTESGDDSKQYIGFVIGALSVVILVLMAAIVFIVFRNHNLKKINENSSTFHVENRLDESLKVTPEIL